jgi:mycothiol S-conjugate amidase
VSTGAGSPAVPAGAGDGRRLLTVHAHPDDEASKGSALVARYVAEGARATLVCCTGGELGEIVNKAMDRPEVLENLAAVRRDELARSTEVIGYQCVELLGYRDSGMPDMEGNADPSNFANAPLEEAVARLVWIIRRDRPHVVITYGDEQGGYPHPDHLRVHEISVHAYDRAADPSWEPDLGPAWRTSKLYYSVWARARLEALHDRMIELGLESPYGDEWFERFTQDHRITSQVDVGAWLHVRDEALRAHATQVDPDEPFWFGLPPDVVAEVYPWDDYILARSEVDTELPEDDLFAGIA